MFRQLGAARFSDFLRLVFFRFTAALLLAVLVSITGIALEKETLQLKRAVSRQYFQIDLLLEIHAQLRLSVQEKTAPAQLAAIRQRTHLTNERSVARNESEPASNPVQRKALPLLRWKQPSLNRSATSGERRER